MTEFRKGQRVRVTYETTIAGAGNGAGLVRVNHPAFLGSSSVCQVPKEYVEPIDDPASDPVGTIRMSPIGPAIKSKVPEGWSEWLLIERPGRGQQVDAYGNVGVRDFEIVGVVPGSPADQS